MGRFERVIAHQQGISGGIKGRTSLVPLSVTVIEKQLDEKHRITVPADFAASVKDHKVIMVSYGDQAVIITGDKRVADELSGSLARGELKRKLKALEDWERMVKKAGLTKMTSRQVDRAMARVLRQQTNLDDSS